MKIDKIIKYYHFVFDNTHNFKGHTHDTYEVNIVLKGKLEVTINENVIQLSPGDMALWSPMMFHCDRVISNNDTEFLSVHFTLKDSNLTKDFFSLHSLKHLDMLLANIFIDEIEQSQPDYTIAEILFNALILRTKKSNLTPMFSEQSDALLYRDTVNFMVETQNRMLCIAEMARHCNVCETTLKKAFKRYTGESIKKYYNELKLQKAKELLTGGKSSKEIVQILGFSSLSYFSQWFKRVNGCSIREFSKETEF